MRPVGISTAPSVNFKGLESKYGYHSGQVQNTSFLNDVKSWEGGSSGKKVAFLTALGLIAAGVVAHKVPAGKLPKAIQPAMKKVQSFTQMVVDKAKTLVGKLKTNNPNGTVTKQAKLQIPQTTEYVSPQKIQMDYLF